MTAIPADKKPRIFTCVERRHMDAEFRVYDAMLAIVKKVANDLKKEGKWKDGDPLPICYAEMGTLANMVDRSKVQVGEQLRKLEDNGWIVDIHPDGRQRRRKGDWASTQYRVLEHAEYVAVNPDSCPALRYNPETGKPIAPGELKKGLLLAKLRAIDLPAERAKLREALDDCSADEIPDKLLDSFIIYAQAVRYTSAGDKPTQGNPLLEPTQGNPLLDTPAKQGNPDTTTQGNPYATSQGNPYARAQGNPYTSLRVEPDPPACPPSLTQPAPEKEPGAGRKGGGVAGWIEKNFATMSTPKGKHKAALDQLVAQHGDDVVVEALGRFLNRPDGFHKVNMPWALFISEADQYLGQVVNERRQKKAQEDSYISAGEKMKAEILARLEKLDPPLTESERAIVQEYVDSGEQMRTNPFDYYIWWLTDERNVGQIVQTIAAKRFHQKKKEEQESGSPLDYL